MSAGTAQAKDCDPLELAPSRDIRVIHAEKDAAGQRAPKFAATVIDYGMQRCAEAFCEQIGVPDIGALIEFLRTDAGRAWRRGCIQLLAQVTAKAAMSD